MASLVVGISGASAAPGGIVTYKSGGGSVGNATYSTGTGAFRAKMNCTSDGAVKYGNRIYNPGNSSFSCGPQGLYALTFSLS